MLREIKKKILEEKGLVKPMKKHKTMTGCVSENQTRINKEKCHII